MVVFDWDFNGGGDHDVMGITVTAAGVPAQNPIPIATGATYDDAYPTVAYNPDAGSYLVAWQRSHNAETYYAIGGSIVAETAGAPFTIYGTAHNAQQRYPDVAYGPGPGRFLVVWESHGAYTLPPDILGATLDGAGSNIQSIHISPDGTTPGQQTYPAVANNESTGRWLVVWNDTRTGGTTGRDIYGQQVRCSAGSVSLWGSVVPIGTIAAEAGAPDVDWGPVGGGNGEFLTVWTEGAYNVYARRVRSDNTLVGGPITVSSTESDKVNATVAYASESKHWWTAWQSGWGMSFIHGQRVLFDGTVRDPSSDQRVSKDPDGYPPSEDQDYPAIAYNSDAGHALVVWQDRKPYDEAYHLQQRARRRRPRS